MVSDQLLFQIFENEFEECEENIILWNALRFILPLAQYKFISGTKKKGTADTAQNISIMHAYV